MKQYFYAAIAVFTLLFASQTRGQTTVDSVLGLKDALTAAQDGGTINITGTLTATESDMMFENGDDDHAGWENFKRIYWYGDISGTDAPTKYQIKNLTLQGSNNAVLDLGVETLSMPGGGLWLHQFDGITLNDLTLSGTNLKTTVLDGTSFQEYGSINFSATAGDGITLNRVTIKDNLQSALNTLSTSAITVGALHAGGMYVMQGATYAKFTDTVFDNNIVGYYEDETATSAAGKADFSAQAGGLYLSNSWVNTYTNGAFTNNKAEAHNARADGGGLLIYSTLGTDQSGSNNTFTNVDFTGNKATSIFSVDADASGSAIARGGAALINSNVANNVRGIVAEFNDINVANNEAEVDAGGFNVNGEAFGGGFAVLGKNKVTFDGATEGSIFSNNKAIYANDTATKNGNAFGGAIAVKDELTDTAFGDVVMDVSNTTFTGNAAQADNGNAWGGAVSVHQINGGVITSTFTNTDFTSNSATSTNGAAQGGAIYNVGNSALTLTDTNFTGNTATGGTTAQGGAIYSENDVLIKAESEDVLFSGNTANGLADSVYAVKNLTYETAVGKTITDLDKVTVGGDWNVHGQGNANFRTVNVTGNTTIDGATVTISDLENSSTGTSTLLKGNGTLVLGDASNKTFNNFTKEDGTVKGGIFTAWNYDETAQTLTAAQRASADLSDGFLAVFGMHSRNTVWKAVRDQMISGSGRYQVPQARYGHGYYGQETFEQESIPFETATSYGSTMADPCAPLAYDPCAPVASGYSAGISPNVAWATYTGRSDEYRSLYNNRDWTYSMEGVQVGTDLFRTKYAQLGLLFGYESGKGTNDWDRINADDTYLGVYATCILAGGADIRGVFGYGWQDYDMNRWQEQTDLYRSSFKGNTIEGNLEIGKRFASGAWSIRPALGVDVISNEIEGAIETGSGSGAVKYGDAKMTQLFVRAGTDLRYKIRGFTLNSGVYYAYDVNGEELNAGVSSIDGLYASQLIGSELGRSMLLFNLGGSLQLTRNLALIGGYQGESILDRDNDGIQSTGYIGGSWKW